MKESKRKTPSGEQYMEYATGVHPDIEKWAKFATGFGEKKKNKEMI